METDHAAYSGYLDEVEVELLRIGTAKCNCLRDQSQLSAVIFLLIRAGSLLRSVLSILDNGRLDAGDAIRRAYLETWLLAFEFRLEGSQPKTILWHQGRKDAWRLALKKIEAYTRSQGIKEPMLGKDYGGLSGVAHPTRSAAENSVALVVAPHGDSIARASVIDAKTKFEHGDLPMTMYRYLWLVIEERPGMIGTEVDIILLPTAVKYANDFAKSLT
jgi:hypothetical protein